MNRAERRRNAARQRDNLKANAIRPEPSNKVADANAAMRKIVVDAAKGMPGYHVTIIVSEKKPAEGQNPHYYMSTSASRGDLLRIMQAFVEKEFAIAQEAAAAAAPKAEAGPT